MIDSGSPISIFDQADLRKLLRTDVIFARPFPENESYVDYNNQPINLVGLINVEVQVGKRKIKNARIVITRDGIRSLIGRDWLAHLNYHVGEANRNIEYNNVVGHIKKSESETLKNKFKQLFTRKGKIKGHTIKIAFRKNAKITQQNGRRVPLQLQKAVEQEIDKLLADGHIQRVERINDEIFIQPVVITVKRDKSSKIALDARSLNNAIQKQKYQMSNLENLMEQVADKINSKDDGTVKFTSLQMLYAYGQTELHPRNN